MPSSHAKASVTCDDRCYPFSPGVCNSGCAGGYTTLAFEQMIEHGTTLEHCVGYSSTEGTDPHSCIGSGGVWDRWNNCSLANNRTNSTVKGSASYGLYSEAEMRTDIFLNGPVSRSLSIYVLRCSFAVRFESVNC